MATLYTTALSANGRKPLVVAHLLDLELEIEEINVYAGEGRAPQYLAINPWGKIPTLVDGELTLWESNAIVEYLAEAYGDYRLTSRDPARRAEIARWLFWETSTWQPAFVHVLTEPVGWALQNPQSDGDPPHANWTAEPLASALRFVDGHLEGREFLVAEELTLADIALAGMMTYARRCAFPAATFPNLDAWYSRIEALRAWRETAVGPWRRAHPA